MAKTRPDNPLVSIVVPVLDEAGCIDELVRRVGAALGGAGVRFEILFVNDGSRDGTHERIAARRQVDPAVKAIHFTRPFGHQAALAAGLCHARGDAVITMDGDLQHPPELLPTLIEAWRGGADVVHTLRRPHARARFSAKEAVGRVFYRVIQLLTPVSVMPGSADFRLLDRRVVDTFNSLQEHFIFARGLIPWMGFSEVYFGYEAGERFAGRSKYRLWPMLRLALDGIFAFSVTPLRLIVALGLATTLFGVGFGIFTLVAYMTGRVDGTGWTTLVILILIFGGVQLLSIGILSEYVGRTYEEAKRRPRYVIDASVGLD